MVVVLDVVVEVGVVVVEVVVVGVGDVVVVVLVVVVEEVEVGDGALVLVEVVLKVAVGGVSSIISLPHVMLILLTGFPPESVTRKKHSSAALIYNGFSLTMLTRSSYSGKRLTKSIDAKIIQTSTVRNEDHPLTIRTAERKLPWQSNLKGSLCQYGTVLL